MTLALAIVHISKAVAVMNGYMGWVFERDEADAIAAPASRILARYTVVQGIVREVSDPLALTVALGFPTYVKWLGYREWKRQKRAAEMAQAQAPPPSPSQARTAGMNGNPTVVDHLRGL